MRAILVTLLLGLGAVPGPGFGATPGEVRIGEQLPDVEMRGLNGPSRHLSKYRGKPLIINVWASWCGPCRAEMASLERLAWLEESRDFSVIGVSTDDYPERAMAWLKMSNATISHFIDARLRIENMLGASRLPLTVLIDSDGRVIDKVFGSRQWDDPAALELINKAFGNRQDTLAQARITTESDDPGLRR